MICLFGVVATSPNRLIMLPFVVLLLAIALGPLIARHHWERHYHKVCIILAGSVCLYYLFVGELARVVHAGIDYATFMVVVGSFFVISGGIHLRAKGPSGPVSKHAFSVVRCSVCQSDWNDRSVDVAYSSMDCDEPRTHGANAYRVFHFSNQQYWRRAPAHWSALKIGRASC